jgi:hypothetical protein
MSSLKSLEARALAARGEVVTARTDTPVAIRLRYIGTGTVTSVVVTATTGIVLTTSDGGADSYVWAGSIVHTAGGGAEGMSTIGLLVDAINSDGIFEATVLDALRSYATDDKFVEETITLSTSEEGYSIWDVKVDTDAAYYLAACLDPKYRLFNRPGKGHRVKLIGYEYSTNFDAAGANCEQVWIRQGTVETQKIGRLSVDTTVTTRNFANGNGELTAPDDAQIIVIVKDAATTWTNATSDYLQVDGIIE